MSRGARWSRTGHCEPELAPTTQPFRQAELALAGSGSRHRQTAVARSLNLRGVCTAPYISRRSAQSGNSSSDCVPASHEHITRTLFHPSRRVALPTAPPPFHLRRPVCGAGEWRPAAAGTPPESPPSPPCARVRRDRIRSLRAPGAARGRGPSRQRRKIHRPVPLVEHIGRAARRTADGAANCIQRHKRRARLTRAIRDTSCECFSG